MKNIREFDDFEGQDGYLIVDGLTEDVSGGKKKLSDIVSEQVQADWEQDDNTQKDYIKNKPAIPTAPDYKSIGDGSGAIRLNGGYITLNFDENSLTDSDDILAVSVPVPNPNDVKSPATDGDVLTYNGDTDEIVWQTPQGGGGTTLPDTTTANAGDVLTLDNNKGLSWSAPQGGGSSTSIIFLNTNTMTATLNGNPITPGEVMELVKTNPYIVLRKCWDYQGVTYYGYDNYYVANYLNGEQQLLYFVCQDFGSGDTVYTDAVRANNCNPSNPIWENV